MPSATPKDPIETYLRPFARCEQAISSLLAVWLNQPECMAVFLKAVEEAACRDDDFKTVRRLRETPPAELEVVVEAYMANAGNIDVAIVSRSRNAVLAIESKTRSLLGKLQLTKYRRALADSDPYRAGATDVRPKLEPRAYSTVLLRPHRAPANGDWSQDADRNRDPEGFDKSVVLGFDVLKQVRAVVGNTLTDTAFFVQETSQHIDELFEDPKQPARKSTDLKHRGAQLRCLARRLKEAGIAHGAVTGTKIPLTKRGWTITLGGGATNSLMIQLGDQTFASKDARGTPEAPPERLVHFAGGYKSVGIPSVFPSSERAWSSDNPEYTERRMLQSAVAVRILQDVMAMMPPANESP